MMALVQQFMISNVCDINSMFYFFQLSAKQHGVLEYTVVGHRAKEEMSVIVGYVLQIWSSPCFMSNNRTVDSNKKPTYLH